MLEALSGKAPLVTGAWRAAQAVARHMKDSGRRSL
jgi:hypothetical protein